MRATSSGLKDETLPAVKHDTSRLRIAMHAGKLALRDCLNSISDVVCVSAGHVWEKKYLLLEIAFWLAGFIILIPLNIPQPSSYVSVFWTLSIFLLFGNVMALIGGLQVGILTMGIQFLISKIPVVIDACRVFPYLATCLGDSVKERMMLAEKDLLLSQTDAPEQIAEQKEGEGDESQR